MERAEVNMDLETRFLRFVLDQIQVDLDELLELFSMEEGLTLSERAALVERLEELNVEEE